MPTATIQSTLKRPLLHSSTNESIWTPTGTPFFSNRAIYNLDVNMGYYMQVSVWDNRRTMSHNRQCYSWSFGQ